MTKKQWSNLRVGHKVKMNSLELDRSQNRPKLINVTYRGTVVRFNSNFSQVLIKFDNGSEMYKGRLGIEVES